MLHPVTPLCVDDIVTLMTPCFGSWQSYRELPAPRKCRTVEVETGLLTPNREAQLSDRSITLHAAGRLTSRYFPSNRQRTDDVSMPNSQQSSTMDVYCCALRLCDVGIVGSLLIDPFLPYFLMPSRTFSRVPESMGAHTFSRFARQHSALRITADSFQ